MESSRKKNSLKNVLASLGGQLLVIVMQFICRTYFVACLSQEYLGINGLFLNIINILSLSELGFGSALLFSMYKPIADNNQEELVHILNLFKKIYRIIALVVAMIGLMLTPFLHLIVRDQPNVDHLFLIYWLFLTNTVVSYLWTYKKSIIEAHQQNYICVFYQKTCIVIQNVIQVIVLLLTHNFILYLLVQIAFTILVNLLLSNKADRMYPYLTKKDNQLPSQIERKKIYKNTTALAYHKFAGVILSNTDNIIMTVFVGVITVGVYSNYCLIISNLGIFINLMIVSLTASIGDMGVKESTSRKREIFKVLQMGAFWIYGFCGVGLFNLLNPVITIWLGKKFLFSMPVVLILVLNFYISGMRRIPCLFIESFGIADDTKYKAVAETIINLVLSIILTRKYGLIGVFLGTIIASLSVFWREGVSLYKNSFKASSKEFFIQWIKYAFCFGAAMFITSSLNRYISNANLLYLFLKAIICFVCYNVIFVLLFYQSEEFKAMRKLVMDMFFKVVGKKKTINV